jgi:UDP-N-acetylglucosamine 2-epimerase
MRGISGRQVRLLSIVGTRPEAIKIAPLAIAARERAGFSHRIAASGSMSTGVWSRWFAIPVPTS